MLSLLSVLLSASSAFAMPCDTGYTCTSASGAYKIGVQHCRYDNRINHAYDVEIKKVKRDDLTMNAGWDGDDFGGFELQFPDQGDVQRILSVEWSHKTGKGLLRDKTRSDNPSPWKTTHVEAITCVDEG